MTKPTRYSPEVRERAVRMLLDQEPSYSSRWAALQSIAAKIGSTPEMPRKWVQRAGIKGGQIPGRTSSEIEELKALRRILPPYSLATTSHRLPNFL